MCACACWIFYNGQSLTDTHEHLPANPVSELLQFLQGEVQWQVSSLEALEALPESVDATTEQLKRYLPKLIKQWLVTEHPALPFHESLFESMIEEDGALNTTNSVDAHNQSEVADTANLDAHASTDASDELEALLDKAMQN